jgi:hypothetical protein
MRACSETWLASQPETGAAPLLVSILANTKARELTG